MVQLRVGGVFRRDFGGDAVLGFGSGGAAKDGAASSRGYGGAGAVRDEPAADFGGVFRGNAEFALVLAVHHPGTAG